MEVCNRKYVNGAYDSLICMWEKTLFRIFTIMIKFCCVLTFLGLYNNHIHVFHRVYNTETSINRFFEHIYTTLIYRLEDCEGDDSERSIVEPTEEEFEELDVFFESLQLTLLLETVSSLFDVD